MGAFGRALRMVRTSGMFTHLISLHKAMLVTDADERNKAISDAAALVDLDRQNVNNVHGQVGAGQRSEARESAIVARAAELGQLLGPPLLEPHDPCEASLAGLGPGALETGRRSVQGVHVDSFGGEQK